MKGPAVVLVKAEMAAAMVAALQESESHPC